MKRLFSFIVVSAMCLPGVMMAQEAEKVEVNLGADVVSTYLWRGQKLGDASVQPSLGIGYKGFSLSAWGSVGLMNNHDYDKNTELDLTLSYSAGGFVIGVTDYYVADDGKYFLYDAHKTSHVFEANVGYDFGPLSLNWFTNFAGADGVGGGGKRAYSSYVEVGVPFTLAGLEFQGAVGAVPWTTSYYAKAHHFSVTNVALTAKKSIRITDHFSLPLKGTVMANPSAQTLHFAVGVSL